MTARCTERRPTPPEHRRIDPGLFTLRVVCGDASPIAASVRIMDAYRGQERLFGARASETTTRRVLKSIDDARLGRVRSARAEARTRVWDAGARPDTITLNIDATLLTAHSEKELAAGNDKHGYGYHPLNCYLDETGEALAAILRPGNAGSNTAADHFTVLALALEQLPAEDIDREILVRTDTGGATHAFTADCHDAGIRFSVGYELMHGRTAILARAAWARAINGHWRGPRRRLVSPS